MTRIAWVYLRWGLHPWEKNYNDQDWALFKTPNATRELWRCWCSPTRWYITPTWRRDSPRRFQGLAAQNGNDNDNGNFFGPGTKNLSLLQEKLWLWGDHVYDNESITSIISIYPGGDGHLRKRLWEALGERVKQPTGLSFFGNILITKIIHYSVCPADKGGTGFKVMNWGRR